jgi:hypothetical protein
MFKIYVFVYDISLQNVFIGSVLNKKKDIITILLHSTIYIYIYTAKY